MILMSWHTISLDYLMKIFKASSLMSVIRPVQGHFLFMRWQVSSFMGLFKGSGIGLRTVSVSLNLWEGSCLHIVLIILLMTILSSWHERVERSLN